MSTTSNTPLSFCSSGVKHSYVECRSVCLCRHIHIYTHMIIKNNPWFQWRRLAMINVDEDNDGNLCFEHAQPKQNNTKPQQHVWKAVGGSVYFINPPPSQLLSNNNVTLNIWLLNKNISYSHEIVCLGKTSTFRLRFCSVYSTELIFPQFLLNLLCYISRNGEKSKAVLRQAKLSLPYDIHTYMKDLIGRLEQVLYIDELNFACGSQDL